MRSRSGFRLATVLACCGCGGSLPTNGAGTGAPAAIAQVRLFDQRGAELTVHTGLPDDQSVRVEARLYAPDGHRLTDIAGGVEMDLRFSPESLATSIAVPGRPLQRLVTAAAPAGTSGVQTVVLSFPGTALSKSFGPFHVQVQRGGPGGGEFRLFDAFNAELTQHVPLVSGETTRMEVRLYDADGRRRTSIPGGVEITFTFDPPSLATASPIEGLPFWKAVTPTAQLGTEGSLSVAIQFLADNSTKTYGPIQVLVH
jgi:hypothetical protein